MSSLPVTALHLPGTTHGVLLLVEDDPDHAFLVRRSLREQLPEDFEVEHLSTAAEAIARMAPGDVRCIVLDLSLPDAKGLEAVLALRRTAPLVPIVVLTGNDNDELGRQALELGAQDYLVKGQHGPDAVRRSVVFALERSKRHMAEQRQALLAERLQLVLEASAEGICLLDDRGDLTFVNRAAAELLGAPASQLLGRPLHAFHVCEVGFCSLDLALRVTEQGDAGEQHFRSLNGELRVLEVRMRTAIETGEIVGSVVNLTDVTVRRQAQESLAEREAQLVDAQRLAHLGSWEWDLATGEVLWSDEMFRIAGLAPTSFTRDRRAFDTYVALVPADERGELELLFDDWTIARPPITVVHRLVRPDGVQRWVECRASASEQEPTLPGRPALRVVGSVQDITEQKVAEDALAHQALHDVLTGLPNRALLLDRLDRAVANPRRTNVAAVFMDLDRFKWVNDSLSHSAGDELLVAVARRLEAVIRPSDTLARFGGDEFVLICPELTSEQQLFDIVERLTTEMERPFVLDGREVIISSSMGLALAPIGEPAAAEALLRDADTALYRAKENGRARFEVFDQAMRERASERVEVLNDLRAAMQHDDFRAWYQPVADLATGHVIGCEALARWEHPQKGVIFPDAFVPYAEETGAIVPIGEAILRQACKQMATWNSMRPPSAALTVSVNLSSRQLTSPQLVATVERALSDSGLNPRNLCLEVTESVVMEDVALSGAALGQLRELGICTAVDDFGTGYSSLAYLLSLPLDVLKIDRSFVQVLESNQGAARAIVKAISALADAVGLSVLAEGVENLAQLEQLASLGVQRGQGYFWGKAVHPAEATWAAPLATSVPSARMSRAEATPFPVTQRRP